MEKMEQLIRQLKEAKPVLKNPESLTDSIMNQIGQRSVHKVSPLLIWTRAALSSAAVLMVGLFIFQQTEAENNIASSTPKPVIENKIEVDSTCIQLLNEDRTNTYETYLCYMQQNSIENKLFKTYPLQKN